MIKLSKIKLQNAVVLENSEMKTIYGGSGSQNCTGGGLNNSVCSGTCLPDVSVDVGSGTLIHYERECVGDTSYAANGSGNSLTVCVCKRRIF